jgi:uncharacterized protein involved in tolerance to divalent cations
VFGDVMLHKSRRWGVTIVASAEELAEKLTEHDWTCCTGFDFGGFYWLNDSTSESGAQEYAVVVKTESGPILDQVETITFGWMNRAQALDRIERFVNGSHPYTEFDVVSRARVQKIGDHGACQHCV